MLEKGNSVGKYVGIRDGKFVVRVDKGTPDAVEHTLASGKNKGKVVSELQYKSLVGKIVSLDLVKKEFGDSIEVGVVDDKEYVLQMPWNSNTRTSLLSRLPNVDYSKTVTFSVFKDTEKNKTVFLIYQEDELVPLAYSKENPNGMPPAKQEKVCGEIKWVFADVEEFLYDVLVAQKKRIEEEVK